MAPPPNSANRKAAADDLPQRNQIGHKTVPRRCTFKTLPKIQDLVRNDEYVVGACGFLDCGYKLRRRLGEPTPARHRIQYNRCKLAAVDRQQTTRALSVVEAKHDDFVEDAFRHAAIEGRRHGGGGGAPGFRSRRLADLDPVVCPMISALDLGNFRAPREGARRLDRKQHRLCPGIDEPNTIEIWNSAAKQLRQGDFNVGRICKAAPALKLPSYRFDYRRKCVTVDQGGKVAIQIEKSTPIAINQMTANPALDVAWGRVTLDGYSRGPIRKYLTRALETRRRLCAHDHRFCSFQYPAHLTFSTTSADLGSLLCMRSIVVAS